MLGAFRQLDQVLRGEATRLDQLRDGRLEVSARSMAFVVVALGSATWGALDLADGSDLGGGTEADTSGLPRLLWLAARAGMLTSFAAMAAAVFLGGWHGPLLPGPAWMALKTVVVLIGLVASRHLVARARAERFVTACWLVLLPLGAVDLAMAGIEALA